MVTIPDAAYLSARVRQEIAVSDWIEIAQDRIDRFADATGDHQWIHVDPVRAAAESPFKATIAHGFLTLSLISLMKRQTIEFANLQLAINYGLNRVRFVTPVPAGSRVRARFTVGGVEEIGGGRLQVTWHVAVELEGSRKPACIVEWLIRYHLKGMGRGTEK